MLTLMFRQPWQRLQHAGASSRATGRRVAGNATRLVNSPPSGVSLPIQVPLEQQQLMAFLRRCLILRARPICLLLFSLFMHALIWQALSGQSRNGEIAVTPAVMTVQLHSPSNVALDQTRVDPAAGLPPATSSVAAPASWHLPEEVTPYAARADKLVPVSHKESAVSQLAVAPALPATTTVAQAPAVVSQEMAGDLPAAVVQTQDLTSVDAGNAGSVIPLQTADPFKSNAPVLQVPADDKDVQVDGAPIAFPVTQAVAVHYFPARELQEKVRLRQDITAFTRLTLPGVVTQDVVLEILINHYGEIDRVLFADSNLPSDAEKTIEELFKGLRFVPGQINGAAVNSRLKIAVTLEAQGEVPIIAVGKR